MNKPSKIQENIFLTLAKLLTVGQVKKIFDAEPEKDDSFQSDLVEIGEKIKIIAHRSLKFFSVFKISAIL